MNISKCMEVCTLCRDGVNSKWPPVLKVCGQLCDNHSKVGQNCNTYTKAFANNVKKGSQSSASPYKS